MDLIETLRDAADSLESERDKVQSLLVAARGVVAASTVGKSPSVVLVDGKPWQRLADAVRAIDKPEEEES